MSRQPLHAAWTFAITAIALFMVASTIWSSPPRCRSSGATSAPRLQDLEWMVNAYTLTFAVLLLTGAALGDRFGRRRVFIIGLSSSRPARLLPPSRQSSSALILARPSRASAAQSSRR